jgi:hypothetical protein
MDHVTQLLLDNHHVVFVNLLCILRLENHQHKDGILQIRTMTPRLELDLFISKNKTDNSLLGLLSNNPLHLLQSLLQIGVLKLEHILLTTVVLDLLEFDNLLLYQLHRLSADHQQLDPLLNLPHFLLVPLPTINRPKFLQLFL